LFVEIGGILDDIGIYRVIEAIGVTALVPLLVFMRGQFYPEVALGLGERDAVAGI
jgi:hypothetical protein